jgi:fructokinase
MIDIIGIGELLIDFTPFEGADGKNCFEQNAGGAPPNMLAMVAKLGGKAAFIGKVGDDEFGKDLKAVLENSNIDASGVVFSNDIPTTLAFVHLFGNGDRDFSFYRKPGADITLEKDEIDYSLIDSAKLLHFGSLSFTDQPSKDSVLGAVKYAKDNSKLISYDPNYRAPLWTSKHDAIEGMKLGLEYCDIIKMSEEEAELLTGYADLDKAGQDMLNRGMKLVLITKGAEGSYFYHKNGSGKVPPFKVKCVDATGAGDAFMGAMLYQIVSSDKDILNLEKLDLEDMLRVANATGALCVGKRGGIPGMPEKHEVEEFLRVNR